MQNANTGKFIKFNASKYKVGIVVAQFNSDITAELLKNAQKTLADYKVSDKNITVHHVAGCVEIPVVLKALADTQKYDCLIALGAVIRGDTAHFDFVCRATADGVLRVMLDTGLPTGFGILTLEKIEQVKGREVVGAWAAEAALQAAKSIKEIKGGQTLTN